MYIMCVCLFSALSRRVGALQTAILLLIIIITITDKLTAISAPMKTCHLAGSLGRGTDGKTNYGSGKRKDVVKCSAWSLTSAFSRLRPDRPKLIVHSPVSTLAYYNNICSFFSFPFFFFIFFLMLLDFRFLLVCLLVCFVCSFVCFV